MYDSCSIAICNLPCCLPTSKVCRENSREGCKSLLLLLLLFHLRSPATECETGVHSTLSPTLCSACLCGTVVATCASSRTTSSHPYPGHICTEGKYAVGNWTSSHTGSSHPQPGHIHAMLHQPPSPNQPAFLQACPGLPLHFVCWKQIGRWLDVLA